MHKPMTPKRLGRGLAAMRIIAGHSQRSLAAAAGITTNTLNRIEQAKSGKYPDLTTIDKVMTALELDWDISWTPKSRA